MEKNTRSLSTAVVDLIFVNLDVVAALRSNNAVVHVVVDLVVGDGEVVRVVVGVETVLVVIVHLVVRPHTTLQREKNERKNAYLQQQRQWHTFPLLRRKRLAKELIIQFNKIRAADKRTGKL